MTRRARFSRPTAFGPYVLYHPHPTSKERRAVRPVLVEDRILAVEQKFFCDRTTEKTVNLSVTDSQNVPLTLWNSTMRLSCQYPLAGVTDLSRLNEMNSQNNTWETVKDRLSCVGEKGGRGYHLFPMFQ